MMAGIRGKNTKPEMIVRRGLHARGFRFRLHSSKLPGKPDLVFRRHEAVIFVNGCFWHGHQCALFKWPSSNREFWAKKIKRNITVDELAHERIRDLGWRVLDIWECSIKGPRRREANLVLDQAARWLNSKRRALTIQGVQP